MQERRSKNPIAATMAVAAICALLGGACSSTRDREAGSSPSSSSRADGLTIAAELPIDTPTVPAGGDAQSPAAAFSGTGYAIAWVDHHGALSDVYAARLDASGTLVGAATLIAATSATSPAVAADGTNFLVAWLEGPVLKATRYSAAGAVLDAPPLVLTSTASSSPSLTFDGTSFVLAWSDLRYTSFSNSDIFAGRVSTAGALLDPNGIIVSAGLGRELQPAIASDGTTSLVVWADPRSETLTTDIFGARVSNAGKVLDVSGLPLMQAGFDQFAPRIAWSGTEYLVVASDTRRTTSRNAAADVYVTRVTAAGKSLDPSGQLVAKTTSRTPSPSVVGMRDGIADLVTWQAPDASAVSWIRGAWVRATNGQVLDDGGVVLVPEPMAAAPALAPAAAAGKAALLYTRVRGAEVLPRLAMRFVDSGTIAGGACTQAKDCRSRYCSDAVCCEEACTGACKRCGGDGKCAAVVSQDDDTCAGTCNAAGACKKKSGDTCVVATECASAFCVDGFCCESACDAGCDVCNVTRGRCTPATAGDRGSPSCSPLLCNGMTTTCPTACLADGDCADGFGCDRPTGTCISGARCVDAVTLRTATGGRTDCRPYACAAGACRASCSGVADCAFPSVCDEGGRCISAPAVPGASCSVLAPGSGRRAPSDAGPLALTFAAMLVLRKRRR